MEAKDRKREHKSSGHNTDRTHNLPRGEELDRLTFGMDSTDVSSTEESKIMKKKKLSIEIPDSADDVNNQQSVSGITLPKNLGPNRSISVQNRTTTITQFSSLSSNEDDQMYNFVPTKVEENIPLKSGKDIVVPNFESTKTSVKRNGVVSAYAANTHQGIVRNYNEDRVSIILNIVKPPSRRNEIWPKCSFFGIYDGHGGAKCAEFLRDYLHQFVIRDPSFPKNPKEAIRNGFKQAENKFLEI